MFVIGFFYFNDEVVVVVKNIWKVYFLKKKCYVIGRGVGFGKNCFLDCGIGSGGLDN